MKDIKINRDIFRLAKKEFITPHFIRVTLQCDNVTPYAICTQGNYNIKGCFIKQPFYFYTQQVPVLL